MYSIRNIGPSDRQLQLKMHTIKQELIIIIGMHVCITFIIYTHICAQFSCTHHFHSYLRKDIDMLEQIQRRATKLPPECVHASSVNMFKNRIDKYSLGGLHIK